MRFASSKVLAALAGAALLVGGGSGARADDPVPTNLGLMTSLTRQVADELYGKFSGSVSDRVVEVRALGTSSDYLFVTNVFVSYLIEKGVEVTRSSHSFNTPSPPPLPPPTGNAAVDSLARRSAQQSAAPVEMAGAAVLPTGALVLQFQNVAFRVAYPDVHRSHVIGGRKVMRDATVRVFATLSDAETGRVLWTGEAERTASDEFDSDELARVEYGNYSFLQPGIPSAGWGKYAEPVFVTGIVVGLIYLFFANQSGN